MMGLEMLDVVIGMIFVFLTLSLVCSAVNEIIEAWLNKRSDYLEKGIKELLSHSGLVKDVYKHPLIAGLFRGKYGEPGSQLPSYIPAENFALALIDTILNPADGNKTSPPVITSPPSAHFSLDSLRNAIDSKIRGDDPKRKEVMKSLRALIDSAGNDANKVKKNIENWFDGSMDRVSGWYKRRTQVIILILGLGVAIGVNADALTIMNSLSHDKALRDSLVVSASEYAKTAAQQTASPTTAATDGKPVSPVVKKADDKFVEACQKSKNDKGLCSETCLQNLNSPECHFEAEMTKIKSLGLPIGWDRTDPKLFPLDWGSWLLKVFGWLITAFAISLGAPFWFDLLNKFMVIRSTVKPKEKSLDEPSK